MRPTLRVPSVLIVLLTFVVPAAASAQSLPPVIHRVTLQPETGVLTIAGTGLGAALVVTVDGQAVDVLPGATATQIEVVVPATVATMTGTFRLTVVDPARQVGDAFVVASQAGRVAGSPVPDPLAGSGSFDAASRAAAARTAVPAAYGRTAAPVRESPGGPSPLVIEDPGAPFRTAIGTFALDSNTTGSYNTANGDGALYSNSIGSFNTGVGQNALNHTTGDNNTAIGFDALDYNTTGNYNTATGSLALYENTTGYFNTATGSGALYYNTTGVANTANGSHALVSNSTGNQNTATGFEALHRNTIGSTNTAIGYRALVQNTGNHNIAVGSNAGRNLTSGDNNIDIGAWGDAGESNVIRIGRWGLQHKAYIQGISGNMLPSGVTVFVNASGQLGTSTSSARFKDEIKPMEKTSEIILALKPVTFRYKKEFDPERIPQFGLVAEDVAKVNPDLVVRDKDGKPYTVRYDAVNAMLLNEFLKEHRTVQELKSIVAKQEATAAQQQKQIEALIATVQEVSAQLELSKAGPQTALNDH
jgi:hypothetical protein